MIEGNVIKFGYGDIAVGSNGMGYVSFTNIKPPLTPGQSITKEIYEGLEIGLRIELYENKAWDIYDLIKTVNENNRIVKYKDFILDFSNYNEESVRVVRDYAYRTVDIRCLAC